MSDFPTGWDYAVLEHLVSGEGIFSDGDWVESKDQDPAGSIRLLQLADIGDGIFLDKSNRFINDFKFHELRCTEIFEGDLLIARMPAPLGRACLMPKQQQRCITVVDVAIFRSGQNGVLPLWLKHFINSPEIRSTIAALASGTTRSRISRNNLSNIEIPVPPINEQKRIADKLDVLLMRVNACRERLDRLSILIKRFRQTIIDTVSLGKLEDQATNTSRVPNTKKLSDVIEYLKTGPFGSALHKSDYVHGGIPVINPMHINNGTITPSDNMAISESNANRLKEFLLTEGDVLIARRGLMGRCAVVRTNESGWLCGTGSMIIRPTHAVLPDYLQLYLSSPKVVAELEAGAVGSTMVNLNQRILLDLDIIVPTIPEQEEIVRRVEILLAFADRLETRVQSARKIVDRVTPALLSKAFRGELVPQDPNDEPSTILLERIHASRAAMNADKPKKVQTNQKSMITTITPETVRETIMHLPEDRFVFDEIRKLIPGDYDALKDALFLLLSEPEPYIRQIFDREANEIQFLRTGQRATT